MGCTTLGCVKWFDVLWWDVFVVFYPLFFFLVVICVFVVCVRAPCLFCPSDSLTDSLIHSLTALQVPRIEAKKLVRKALELTKVQHVLVECGVDAGHWFDQVRLSSGKKD